MRNRGSLVVTVHGRRSRRVIIPPELVSSDRVLQRWAVSIGSGLPTDFWDDATQSRVPPLDDDTARIVDQLVMRSPPRKVRRIIMLWYRTPEPVEHIAEKIKDSPENTALRVIAALCYMSLKFKENLHPKLTRILR